MGHFWIFVVVDAHIGRSVLAARDILEERLRRLYWLINPRNPFAERLEEGDKVVFYLGGKSGGSFAAACTLMSSPRRISPEIKRYVVEDPGDQFNYAVNLREVDYFPKPLEVSKILKRLKFIRNKDRWWSYFQGSVISISEDDYAEILDMAGSIPP